MYVSEKALACCWLTEHLPWTDRLGISMGLGESKITSLCRAGCAGVPALQFFRVWSREGCACWDAFPAVWWRRGVLAELASSDKAPGGDRSKHAVRISFPRSYMRQRCSSITCSAGSFLLLTTKYANRAVALPAFLVF